MLRFLATSTLTLLGNALGLIIASLLLTGFQIHPLGFTVSVLFFTGVEILFGPFVLKMALRYLPARRGGIVLVTTFVGLLLTSIFTDSLSIRGLSTWVMAPPIIWISVLLAGVLLPMVIFKKTLATVKQRSEA